MSPALTLDALRSEDVAEVARLHRSAFPGFFLTSLGEPFLREFYRGFLADEGSTVTAVARGADGVIVGVAVGTTQPRGFFTRLLRRRWLGLATAAARAVVHRPSSAARLARAAFYRGDPPADTEAALLSSICVKPAEQGTGVGQALLQAWTDGVVSRGVRTAYLTTDAEANDGVNRFYRRQGWTPAGSYRTPQGRHMNRYTRALGG